MIGKRIRTILLFLGILLVSLLLLAPLGVWAATGILIEVGDHWAYFKGTTEPPPAWNTLGFDDSGWLSGPTGIGYGDYDDATVLDDMPENYLSVYLRRTFTLTDPTALTALRLNIDYDDGFVAYLNGVEVARRNMGPGGQPAAFDAAATAGHEAGLAEEIDISHYLDRLQAGENVLAIQVHNKAAHSTDLSLIPELVWVSQVTLIRHPYLQQLGAEGVMVVWTTAETGTSQVAYSSDLSLSQVVTAETTFKSVSAPALYDLYYEHVAVLSGLTTNTTYHYSPSTAAQTVVTDTALSFKTDPGPEAGCVYSFPLLGDSGQNVPGAQAIRDIALARGFDLAINMGDLAYNDGTYGELEENYFKLYQAVLWNKMIWPTLGNHEYRTAAGGPYLDVFHLPQQAMRGGDHERYYSFDYGDAHFVVLDTNTPVLEAISDAAVDDMADWLTADLAANDRFWTIVAMHHPWYISTNRTGAQNHPPIIRDVLAPIFEQYGVDLVVNGHDHVYERTHPIKQDGLSTVAEGGIIYITNGEAGAKGNSYGFEGLAPDWSAFRSDQQASYTHVYIDHGVMSIITLDDQNNVIDPAGGSEPLVIIDRSQEVSPCTSRSATLSGTVYEDSDSSNSFSPADLPLPGVTVLLRQDTVVMTATTTISGFYQFDRLLSGQYTIVEVDLPGYLSVMDSQGANDNTISVSLTAADRLDNNDFLDRLASKTIYMPLIIK